MQKAHTWRWLYLKAKTSQDVDNLRHKGFGKASIIPYYFEQNGVRNSDKKYLAHNRGDVVRVEAYFKGCEVICK